MQPAPPPSRRDTLPDPLSPLLLSIFLIFLIFVCTLPACGVSSTSRPSSSGDSAAGAQGSRDPGVTREETDQTDPRPLRKARELEVREISSGERGGAVKRPEVLISGSLESLITALPSGADPRLRRDLRSALQTEGVYLTVFRGRKRTGGYEVSVESSRLEGQTVRVALRLEDPPEGAMVTQQITNPYTVVLIEGLDPSGLSGKTFVFVDSSGRELDWRARKTRRVGSRSELGRLDAWEHPSGCV